MSETSLMSPVTFIEDAKLILDRADECRKEKARVQGEVRQCEKAVAVLDKAVADTINTTLRSRKEVLAAGYDEKLSVCQNKIKDCRAERGKAKADAIAERIQRENAPLDHENNELTQQVEQIYEENNIKSVFKKHGLVVLFFPKRSQDWLTAAGIAAGLMFLVPLFFILAMRSQPVALAFTLFIYHGCLFGGYLYLLYKFMLSHQHVHQQAEELKAKIRDNTKKMTSVSNNIRKSQDETGYNLGIYDDRIAEIETEMKTILSQRKNALDEFERVTRNEIAAEVTAANADEKQKLTKQLTEKQQEADVTAKALDDVEAEIRDSYENRLGKDMMNRQKLTGLGTFCEENPELPLEQAIDCYRSTKK